MKPTAIETKVFLILIRCKDKHYRKVRFRKSHLPMTRLHGSRLSNGDQKRRPRADLVFLKRVTHKQVCHK
jgi:hypothetical protein